MSDSANLALLYIEAAQAQKHVTHNDALALLDACVQLSVVSRNTLAAPVNPAPGARYIIGAGATGAFAGRTHQIAYWDAAGWRFLAPQTGWMAWVASESASFVLDARGWTAVESLLSQLQNLQRLGVGTMADAANPFAAKLNAVLFAARSNGEGGNGDLRFTLNKEAASGTVSQIYQTAWSARAETGLMGDDKFRIKVSADGASWRDGLEIDPASGVAAFNNGARAGAAGFSADMFAGKSFRLASDAIISDASVLRTLSPSDNGRIICFTSASSVSVVAPVGLGAGFSCAFIQDGAGLLTFSAGSGVSLGQVENAFRSGGRHATISLLAIAPESFVLSGALVT
jgi:hypothetical protein